MKIVVTGASGLIGTALLEALGHETDVIGLTRGVTSGRMVHTDYTVENLTGLFTDTDTVVHLAAIRDYGGDYQHFTGNAELTENILKAAVQAGVKRMIYMSSIAVYTDVAKVPWKEDQAVSPQTFYGLSKIVGEHLCELYARKGLAYTIFRCGIVFGMTDNNRMTDIFIRNAASGHPITVKGRSVAKRDFIYLKEVVNALCWELKAGHCSNQVYNLGSGMAYTNLQMAEAINRAFGNEGNLVYEESGEENLTDSYMDSTKLREAGYTWQYSLAGSLADLRTEWGKNP